VCSTSLRLCGRSCSVWVSLGPPARAKALAHSITDPPRRRGRWPRWRGWRGRDGASLGHRKWPAGWPTIEGPRELGARSRDRAGRRPRRDRLRRRRSHGLSMAAKSRTDSRLTDRTSTPLTTGRYARQRSCRPHDSSPAGPRQGLMTARRSRHRRRASAPSPRASRTSATRVMAARHSPPARGMDRGMTPGIRPGRWVRSGPCVVRPVLLGAPWACARRLGNELVVGSSPTSGSTKAPGQRAYFKVDFCA
jgi:hypothetical protein